MTDIEGGIVGSSGNVGTSRDVSKSRGVGRSRARVPSVSLPTFIVGVDLVLGASATASSSMNKSSVESASDEDDDNTKSSMTSNGVEAACISVGNIVGDCGTTAMDFGDRRRRRVDMDDEADVHGRVSSAIASGVG